MLEVWFNKMSPSNVSGFRTVKDFTEPYIVGLQVKLKNWVAKYLNNG